jgi:hypothetical protein
MSHHDHKVSPHYRVLTGPVLKLAAMALALQMAWAPAHAQSDSLISIGRDVYASSALGNHLPELAVDGSVSQDSRWESVWKVDPQWMYVDLGAVSAVSHVVINWEAAYAVNFEIQSSDDEIHWQTVVPVTGNASQTNDIPLNIIARIAQSENFKDPKNQA